MRFMDRRLRRAALLLIASLAVMGSVLCTGAGLARAGTPLPPTQDPFYAWSGSLAGVANGTVLRTRQITFDASGLTVPVTSDQLLFKTTDELGAPIVAATTVVQPLQGATHKILSYQWAYDGLAANCEPSFAIQGGTPTEGTNAEEQILSVTPLLAGETVVVTDYEGEASDFTAGRMEGQITLDGIKAAENFFNDPADTQVAMVGYSGGAIATDWAAELATSYAPTLDFVGAAFGGIAVDLEHNLAYVNGSQEWSGAIPASLIGISRAFDINLTPYLSAYGQQIVNNASTTCLQSDLGSYPGLTLQKMLKPQYTNVDQVPPFLDAMNKLIMGTGGIPQEPLYMGVGDADGTGDDVMVDADDEALAHKYCSEGLSVEFNLYKNENHGDAAIAFLPQSLDWAISMLAGLPARQGCAAVPVGDSLAPETAQPAGAPMTTSTGAARATLQLQYRSVSAGRTVHLRLRAVHAAISRVTVELTTARGRILVKRTMRAARGKLLLVTLTPKRRLAAGRYEVVAKSGTRILGRRSFTIRGS